MKLHKHLCKPVFISMQRKAHDHMSKSFYHLIKKMKNYEDLSIIISFSKILLPEVLCM